MADSKVLQWDADGSRLYETGVDKVALYVYNTFDKGYTGLPTSETDKTGVGGVAWNGVSSIQESPSGADANDIYADNKKYLSLRAAEDFGCTIEAYTYPDAWAVCDGSVTPSTAPGLTIGQQTRQTFGLSFRSILGNDVQNNEYGYLIHLIYKATASPSERSYSTVNDSPEAISFSWEVTCLPVDIEGYKPSARLIVDSTKATPAGLKALEDALYGTATSAPYLPSPAEVMELLATENNAEG